MEARNPREGRSRPRVSNALLGPEGMKGSSVFTWGGEGRKNLVKDLRRILPERGKGWNQKRKPKETQISEMGEKQKLRDMVWEGEVAGLVRERAGSPRTCRGKNRGGQRCIRGEVQIQKEEL